MVRSVNTYSQIAYILALSNPGAIFIPETCHSLSFLVKSDAPYLTVGCRSIFFNSRQAKTL